MFDGGPLPRKIIGELTAKMKAHREKPPPQMLDSPEYSEIPADLPRRGEAPVPTWHGRSRGPRDLQSDLPMDNSHSNFPFGRPFRVVMSMSLILIE